MKKLFYHMILFCFAILFSQQVYSAATIQGTVTDAVTGLPIANALVEALRGNTVRYSATTDSNGMYILSNVQPSNYTLIISASGYQTQAIGVKAQNNQITTVNVALIPNGGQIAGTVTDANTMLPIANTLIQIFQGTQLITSAITDGVGNYSINNLAPGEYTVLAQATGFQEQIKGAIVTTGATTIVDFALSPNPGSISGTVIDATTTLPIEDAFVEVFSNNVLVGFANTDINGNYTIPDLAPGNYIVVVTADGYKSKSEGAIVVSNATTIVNFALDPNPGTIEGAVTNASNGVPIAGARITIFQDSVQIISVLTDINGQYSISDLVPGTYTVIAMATNFTFAATGAIVTSNNTSTVNFALLPKPGSIAGTVTDASTTAPIAGAIINIFNGPIVIATTVTDPSGNYQIPVIDPGTYTVVVQAGGYQIQFASATVNSGVTTIVNFALQTNAGSIAGTVTDATTSNPIPDATIAVFQGTTLIAIAVTDANGNYGISNLAPGNYIVLARAAGYQAAFLSETVVANSTTIANFALNTQPGAIAGRVTNACNNDPIAGALVVVEDNGVIVGFDLTDMTGEYLIDGLAPGDYSITVVKKNFVLANAVVTVQTNETSIQDFILIPAALPPLNVSKTFIHNCYLTRTDHVPVICWTASPGVCITGYYVFRNEARIAFVPTSQPLCYVDRCFCNKLVRYSIQTINSFGQLSPLIVAV